MDWTGDRFSHVRVIRGRREEYRLLGEVNKRGYQGRWHGQRSLWTQPLGADGKPKPVYYGDVPFVFRGEVQEFWSGFRLTAYSATKACIQRLLKVGVPQQHIRIIFVDGDFYVFVDPKVISSTLSPGPLFIVECAIVARKHMGGLPYDPDVYQPEATMPLYGSKQKSGLYVSAVRVDEFLRDVEGIPEGLYALAAARTRRHPRERITNIEPLSNESYHPLDNALNPSIRDYLPNGLQTLLQIEIAQDKLENLCFAMGLAIKDAGGTPEEAMAFLAMAVRIDRIEKGLRQASVNRAFAAPYHFGWRTFAEKFSELKLVPQPQKSPYIHFERQWLAKLIEANAPYTAHKLLYQLLCQYHQYPKPILSVPEWESGKLRRGALRSLQELSIITFESDHEVCLCMEHKVRRKNYIRLPVEYLQRVAGSKQAIRLFSVILRSVQHYKDHRGLWTTVKIETLCERLGIGERTFYSYLKELRRLGIPIDHQGGMIRIFFVEHVTRSFNDKSNLN